MFPDLKNSRTRPSAVKAGNGFTENDYNNNHRNKAGVEDIVEEKTDVSQKNSQKSSVTRKVDDEDGKKDADNEEQLQQRKNEGKKSVEIAETQKETQEEEETPEVGKRNEKKDDDSPEIQLKSKVIEEKKGSEIHETSPSVPRSVVPKTTKLSERIIKKIRTEPVKGELTRTLFFAIMCTTIGGFQFGYNIGCMNSSAKIIETWMTESHSRLFGSKLATLEANFMWSATVSIFPFGATIGGLSAGALADISGRRGGLLYTNILIFVSAALVGFGKITGVYPMIFVGRLLVGIYVGLTVIVPMYLSEVAPPNIRGRIALTYQLLITIGILSGQIAGHPQLLGTSQLWPFIFAIPVVPAFLQVMFLPMIPESPYYSLCVRGDVAGTMQNLEELRGKQDIFDEYEMIQEEALESRRTLTDYITLIDLFRGSLRFRTIITMVMMLSQQLGGINAAIFYSTRIFNDAGLDEKGALNATLMMGVGNVLSTIFVFWLIDSPFSGRRPLMIYGMVGMIISTTLLVISLTLSKTKDTSATYFSIIFLVMFVVSFAVGPGSVAWIYTSEIFFTNARANANAVLTVTNWGTNSIVSFAFLPIVHYIGQYSFLIFTFFTIIFVIFLCKYMPETRGKTVAQTVAYFEGLKVD
ncbi:hypothetical protein RB195_017368 [Necator americanus]|uniref:Major facilitator superfamily (MFS) profile domain-containing protein n=1 Tax=Necator americanus TaxID=51031 RepID=A0ABR1C4W2_NECAM